MENISNKFPQDILSNSQNNLLTPLPSIISVPFGISRPKYSNKISRSNNSKKIELISPILPLTLITESVERKDPIPESNPISAIELANPDVSSEPIESTDPTNSNIPTPPVELNRLENSLNSSDVDSNKSIEFICREEGWLKENPSLYFGIRNQIELIPKRYHNYDAESLSYMISRVQADKIAKGVSLMLDGKPKIVIDATAGIGGITLALMSLSREQIVGVIAYEKDPIRRNFLINNLQGYQYPKDRYHVGGQFNGINPEIIKEITSEKYPIVLIFDPPWIQDESNQRIFQNELNSSQICSPSCYQLSGLKIDDDPLEEWIDRSTQADAVLLRLPRNYQLSHLKNFTATATSNPHLILCLNNSILQPNLPPPLIEQENSLTNTLETPEDFSNKTIQSNSSNMINIISQRELKEHLFKSIELSRNYQVQEDDPSQYNFLDQENWIEQLKTYLKDELLFKLWEWAKGQSIEKYIGSYQPGDLLDEKYLKTWIITFTHESVNRNSTENYEALEHLGDKVMGLNFCKYLFEKFPEISNSQLNTLAIYFMSKMRQNQFSAALDLSRYVRTFYDYGVNLSEDIIEAFFGALYQVGNRLEENLGDRLCYLMMKYLFRDMPIDINRSYISPIAELNDISQRYGWGPIGLMDELNKPTRKNTVESICSSCRNSYEGSRKQSRTDQNSISSGNYFHYTGSNQHREGKFYVSDRVLTTLSQFSGKSLGEIKQIYPNNCLVSVNNVTERGMHEQINQLALNELRKYGVTRDFQKISKRNLPPDDLTEDYQLAIERANREGYQNLRFPKIWQNNNICCLQLIGSIESNRPNGQNGQEDQIEILITIKTSLDLVHKTPENRGRNESCKDPRENTHLILKSTALLLYAHLGRQVLPYRLFLNK